MLCAGAYEGVETNTHEIYVLNFISRLNCVFVLRLKQMSGEPRPDKHQRIRTGMSQVISANRLSDGIVVFRAKGGAWVEHLRDAEILADAAAVKAALGLVELDVKANHVIEVAAFEVAVKDGHVEPVHLRDKIRAKGPTTHPLHGKQAAH